MPLTYIVDRENHLLRSHGSGPLTTADLIDYLTKTRADPDYDPTMNRLMDLREITSLPSSADVRSLAMFMRAKAPVDTARMAILASSDLAFGVAMMFKAFVGYGERFLVVRSEEEANAWLADGSPPG
jgi:hypothetical protein